VAKELFDTVGPLDYLFVCVGGGGLISGSALAAKSVSPGCKVNHLATIYYVFIQFLLLFVLFLLHNSFSFGYPLRQLYTSQLSFLLLRLLELSQKLETTLNFLFDRNKL